MNLFPLGGVSGWSVLVAALKSQSDWTPTQSMAPLTGEPTAHARAVGQ